MSLTALLTLSLQAIAPHPMSATPIDPGSWVTSEDYPPDARRAGAEGRVEVALTVGDNGSVRACAVSRSSGSASLDGATCRLILERGRFKSATDAAGKPVEGTYSMRFAWDIPQGGSLVIQVTKSDAGFVCTTEHGGQRHVIKADWCKTWTDTIRSAGGDPLKALTIHDVGDPAEFIARHLQ